MPDLVRLDGRSAVARRVKRTVVEIKNELSVGRRLSNAENAAVQRVAVASVVADIAMHKALLGQVPFTHATRAASNARRERNNLAKAITSKGPAREPTYDELMAEHAP